MYAQNYNLPILLNKIKKKNKRRKFKIKKTLVSIPITSNTILTKSSVPKKKTSEHINIIKTHDDKIKMNNTDNIDNVNKIEMLMESINKSETPIIHPPPPQLNKNKNKNKKRKNIRNLKIKPKTRKKRKTCMSDTPRMVTSSVPTNVVSNIFSSSIHNSKIMKAWCNQKKFTPGKTHVTDITGHMDIIRVAAGTRMGTDNSVSRDLLDRIILIQVDKYIIMGMFNGIRGPLVSSKAAEILEHTFRCSLTLVTNMIGISYQDIERNGFVSCSSDFTPGDFLAAIISQTMALLSAEFSPRASEINNMAQEGLDTSPFRQGSTVGMCVVDEVTRLVGFASLGDIDIRLSKIDENNKSTERAWKNEYHNLSNHREITRIRENSGVSRSEGSVLASRTKNGNKCFRSQSGLTISRSLGNADMTVMGSTCVPEVYVHDIKRGNWTVIMSSQTFIRNNRNRSMYSADGINPHGGFKQYDNLSGYVKRQLTTVGKSGKISSDMSLICAVIPKI